jgi:hypothetical protein
MVRRRVAKDKRGAAELCGPGGCGNAYDGDDVKGEYVSAGVYDNAHGYGHAVRPTRERVEGGYVEPHPQRVCETKFRSAAVAESYRRQRGGARLIRTGAVIPLDSPREATIFSYESEGMSRCLIT